MTWQLPADPHVSFTGLQTVNGANIVETPTSDEAARRSVGTGHHPR